MKKLLDRLKVYGSSFLRPNGKYKFIRLLPPNSNILDVGCGNNSPYMTLNAFSSINYTGLDIADYNQTKYIDGWHYVLTTPDDFSNAILQQSNIDAIISAHNLEHCDDFKATLLSMAHILRPGGKLYLAFPCEQSVNFPSRSGTLNYYDDPTHNKTPPNLDFVINTLVDNGMRIDVLEINSRPFFFWLIGFFNERRSQQLKKILRGTADYYGFETIIWATKIR